MATFDFNKETIRRRFTRGMLTYGGAASIQKTMAAALISQLAAIRTKFGSVLEIGAGTGVLTELIEKQLEYSELALNDIVPECAEFHKNRNAKFFAGDIEETELSEQYSLVISNATFQWLKNIDALFEKLKNAIAADGILAFTTYGPKNLKEIENATGYSLNYQTADAVCEKLEKNDFEILYRNEEFHVLEFPTPIDVLRHLKNSGANAANAEPWTKGALNSFSWFYREHHTNSAGNCLLTYHPLAFIARKKLK